VIFAGANLPHYWQFDDVYFEEDSKATADVRVSHLNEKLWGEQFLQLSENNNIKAILEKAKRGLQVTGKSKQLVAEILEKLIESEGNQRIIYLIEALSAVANCKQLVPLSSIGFKPDLVEVEIDRINAIYGYSIKNFRNKIQLEEIAEVANISPNSFCRYFKSRHGKHILSF
jgi:AraC-like DNA-binding protein